MAKRQVLWCVVRLNDYITEVRTEEGKLHLFVAQDRTSKFAFAKLCTKAITENAKDFLELLFFRAAY